MHNSYNSTMRATLAHLDAYRRNASSSGKRTPQGKNVRGSEGERFRRGMQVSRCHGNTRREHLRLPVTLPTGLARKEEERMRRDDEEARSAPSKGESATRSSSHPAWCFRRLIGRTVACAEHIGKAIRKAAKNYVTRAFTIRVSAIFRETILLWQLLVIF